ncbi:MAG: PHP domain-containing protein [Firmicutes bacterium]|nr:PHP domain-containing protein [Bacillota bacterium]
MGKVIKEFVKFETHLHTKETFACAKVAAEEIPQIYKKLGFDGIVVTNHFMQKVLDQYEVCCAEPSLKLHTAYEGREISLNTNECCWHKKVDGYLQGFKNMQKAGKKAGVKIFFGLELGLLEYDKLDGKDPAIELLVYGVEAKDLYDTVNFHALSHARLFEIANQKGWLIYQAHPARKVSKYADPKLLHGAEVWNANPRHYNFNDEALGWVSNLNLKEGFNLKKLSGSDFHRECTAGRAGIMVPKGLKNIQQLVEFLRHNDPGLIMGDLHRIY